MESHNILFKDSVENPKRSLAGLTLDFGNQRISEEQFKKLIALAEEKDILGFFRDMRSGKIVNPSENRPALHTSLRDISPNASHYEEVQTTLKRMCELSDGIRSGAIRGSKGETINHVVNIGIGGSYLGPKAVYEALRAPKQDIKISFLSSPDGVLFDRIMAEIDPYRTIFVISSKSFGTVETLINAEEVVKYLKSIGMTQEDLKRHLITVSAKDCAPEAFGLPKENHYPIWEWVGGRFSVWSAIGLPLIIALGKEVFLPFLEGARKADDHTENAPLEENIPVLLALIDYWNTNALDIPTVCFLPYDERLNMIGNWRQQLEMESLGKTTLIDGSFTEFKTCPILWGGNGDESQHSFFQWLREGSGNTSIDLVSVKDPKHGHENLFKVLNRNVKAQTKALLMRNTDQYFNVITSIELDELTPETLGTLMALYENKVCLLGKLFGLNPFDQPGVELGKKLAREAEE